MVRLNEKEFHRSIVDFQLEIAKRWNQRGSEKKDDFVKFFFYFAGFNSLYYLWRVLDNLKKRDGERKHIENLLKKFTEAKAAEILEKVDESVEYFRARPIRKMIDRSSDRPDGDLREGEELMSQLENGSNKDRIVALGKILYLIRSNLVHGSKRESGDDREIVKQSIAPLDVLLEEAISLTEQEKIRLRRQPAP